MVLVRRPEAPARPVITPSVPGRSASIERAAGLRPVTGSELSALHGAAPASRAPAQLQAQLARDSRLDLKLLKQFGFDLARFAGDASRIAAGTLTESGGLLSGGFSPATGVDEVRWTGDGATRLRELGERALRRGEVAVVVLNGGMATRFGGVVKGVVEVFDGKSFLALKASDVARASKTYGSNIPLVLMNSFATREATMKHVAEKGNLGLEPDQILTFDQSISVRMKPDGSVFIGEDGQPSYHAPGHGDFFETIKRSGTLAELERRGVKTILFSNVDNLAATIDPVVIGHHLEARAEMTAELAPKAKTASGEWDKGASPVRFGDRVQLVEGFRLPADLSPVDYPDLSTNNFLFSLEALKQDIPLERYVVRKKVKNEPVLQLESITCEASGVLGEDGKPLLDLHLIRVPRSGDTGRFFPIKEPDDLEANREELRARLEAGWRQRDGV